MNTPILVVTSVKRAITWYEEILGFDRLFPLEAEAVSDDLAYVVLGNDNGALHLGRDREMEQSAGHGGFEMATTDFDGIHARAQDHNVTFYFDISLNPAGCENFAIVDPDGNRIIVVRDA